VFLSCTGGMRFLVERGMSKRLLIRRDFVVSAPIRAAWDHLARVEEWPSWARHIRRIDLTPAGELGPTSAGVIRLENGIKWRFQVTEFSRRGHWTWVGRFLWLTVEYVHRFEPEPGDRTRLTWEVWVDGRGAGSIGRVFAAIYRRNLDKAIPRLIEEM